MHEVLALGKLPIGKQRIENGYRTWGSHEIYEFERTAIKRGLGKRYAKHAYAYSKLYQCKRCGKIGGQDGIRNSFFDFSINCRDYENYISGEFCSDCRAILQTLEEFVMSFRQNEKLLRELKKEITKQLAKESYRHDD